MAYAFPVGLRKVSEQLLLVFLFLFYFWLGGGGGIKGLFWLQTRLGEEETAPVTAQKYTSLTSFLLSWFLGYKLNKSTEVRK